MNTMLFEFFTVHADGRWYLDGRDYGRDAANAVESFYGGCAIPLHPDSNVYRVMRDETHRPFTVRALQDARESAYAGHTGTVRLPENHDVRAKGRCEVTAESLRDRLPEDVVLPYAWKETSFDRRQAAQDLYWNELGTDPGWLGPKHQRVAQGIPPRGDVDLDHSADDPPAPVPVARHESRTLEGRNLGRRGFPRVPQATVGYTDRPPGDPPSTRPLDSLLRQLTMSERRRRVRQDRNRRK